MRIPIAAVLSLLLFLVPAPASFADDDSPSSADIAKSRAQADKGDPEAQFDLGEAYLKGEGVPQSEKEAAKWYARSAAQGYVDAQVAMGFVYRGGSASPMDKVLSYMWFDLAAKNGSTEAFGLRNDVAVSMTQDEIDEARSKARHWKPKPEKAHSGDED